MSDRLPAVAFPVHAQPLFYVSDKRPIERRLESRAAEAPVPALLEECHYILEYSLGFFGRFFKTMEAHSRCLSNAK